MDAMGKLVWSLATALVVLPGAGWAQCRADVDCKGERICVSGECRDPAPAALLPPPPPPSDTLQPPPPPPPRSERVPEAEAERGTPPSAVRELPGWALGGAVMGFVSAGMVGVLAVGSAATSGALFPSLPLGALATLIFGITVPLVASAASSARNGTGVSGVLGLRIVGWIFYGLTLANAVVAVVLGVTTTVPAPIILSLGALGILTEVFMSIDALVSRGQAVTVVEHNRGAAGARAAPGFRVVPMFSLTPSRLGGAAATFGVAGTF